MQINYLSRFFNILVLASICGVLSDGVYAKNKGLYNNDAHCFLNASLQVLTQTKPFMWFLHTQYTPAMRLAYKTKRLRTSPLGEFYELSQAMGDGAPEVWYKNIQDPEDKAECAAQIFRSSLAQQPVFKEGDGLNDDGQKDPSEFFTKFIPTVKQEVEDPIEEHPSAFEKIFNFAAARSLFTCAKCHITTPSSDTTQSDSLLVVRIPEGERLTLFKCLEKTFKNEPGRERDCPVEGCGGKRAITTRNMLGMEQFKPQIFTCMLSRFDSIEVADLSITTRGVLEQALTDQEGTTVEFVFHSPFEILKNGQGPGQGIKVLGATIFCPFGDVLRVVEYPKISKTLNISTDTGQNKKLREWFKTPLVDAEHPVMLEVGGEEKVVYGVEKDPHGDASALFYYDGYDKTHTNIFQVAEITDIRGLSEGESIVSTERETPNGLSFMAHGVRHEIENGAFVRKAGSITKIAVKNGAPITIPMGPVLNDFLSTHEFRDVVYNLYGIIVHGGASVESGHYWAIVKDGAGSWYRYNDSLVTPLSIPAVEAICLRGLDDVPGYSNGTPYMLFYELPADQLGESVASRPEIGGSEALVPFTKQELEAQEAARLAAEKKLAGLRTSLQILKGKLGKLSGKLAQLKAGKVVKKK